MGLSYHIHMCIYMCVHRQAHIYVWPAEKCNSMIHIKEKTAENYILWGVGGGAKLGLKTDTTFEENVPEKVVLMILKIFDTHHKYSSTGSV